MHNDKTDFDKRKFKITAASKFGCFSAEIKSSAVLENRPRVFKQRRQCLQEKLTTVTVCAGQTLIVLN